MLHLLTSVSSVRLYIPKDLRPYDNRQLMLKSIQVQSRAISRAVEDISVNHLHFFFSFNHFVHRRCRNVSQMAFLCLTP